MGANIQVALADTTIYSSEFLLDYDFDSSAWIIDRFGDEAGNLELRFGNVPSHHITFDVSNDWFAFGTDINLQFNQLKNVALDNRASAPPSPVSGQIYFNTTDHKTYIWDGAQWKDLYAMGHAQNTDIGTTANTFSLDLNHSGGDTALNFNNGSNASIRWDITNTRFVVNKPVRIEGNEGVVGQIFIANDHTAANSDGIINLGREGSVWQHISFNAANNLFETSTGLSVGGNLQVNGNTFTMDADNTGAGQNVSLVAHQGTNGDGTLRYNATTKQWEISNNGGTYAPLASGYTTLFAQTAATTAACPNGGYVFTSGLDANRNNILDASEVATTATVCNGSGGGNGNSNGGGGSTLAGSCVVSQTASFSGSAQYSVSLSGMDSYSNNTLEVNWVNGLYISSIANSNGGSSSWLSPLYLLSILGSSQSFMFYANYLGTPPAGQLPYISNARITKNGNSLNCVVNQ